MLLTHTVTLTCKQTWTAITKATVQNPEGISCNPDRYTRESPLKYHWSADDEIMRIINRRNLSPKFSELVERRIELTRPGHMSYQWHEKLEKEILLPRSAGDAARKEIKRIDTQLQRKEECRHAQAWWWIL